MNKQKCECCDRLATRYRYYCIHDWTAMTEEDREAIRAWYRQSFGDAGYQIELLAELAEGIIAIRRGMTNA